MFSLPVKWGGSCMAVSQEEAYQADLGLPAITVSIDVYLLVFDGAPKPLDPGVVEEARPS
jgi:hypothetical protein